MENKLLLSIEDKNFILNEVLIETDGDTLWNIKDPKQDKDAYFVVHTDRTGRLYVTFFKRHYVSNNCSLYGISKICEILLERNLKPTIKIHYTNKSLITLCYKVGFRKYKNVKHLYYLKKLNLKKQSTD